MDITRVTVGILSVFNSETLFSNA